MNPQAPKSVAQPTPVLELALVIGLPLLSVFAGVGLVIVSYFHGFADLGVH